MEHCTVLVMEPLILLAGLLHLQEQLLKMAARYDLIRVLGGGGYSGFDIDISTSLVAQG